MMRSLSLRRGVLLCAIILVCGYALFEARGLLQGPSIVIESPRSGQTITEPLPHILGRAARINSITMNDRPIFISEEGLIDEPIALLPGYNEITFKGTDRFGKTTQVDLALLYRADAHGSPAFSAFSPVASSSQATSSAAVN